MKAVKRITFTAVLIVAVLAISGQALAAGRYVLPGPGGSTVYVFSSGRNLFGLNLIFKDIYGEHWATILRYLNPRFGLEELLEPSVPEEEEVPPTEPETPSEEPVEEPEDPADSPTDVKGLTANEKAMLDLVNKEREKAGLKPLAADLELVRLARMKSQDMIDKGYFSHTSPTYGSPFDMMKKAGISYKVAGENLAGASTVQQAHTSLMNSDGHRRNILNPNFDHIGIGIIEGGPYGMMFTQMFTGQ
jgi:uncharacterized YkwD family protein